MKYAMEITVVAIILFFAAAFVLVLTTGDHEWAGSDDQAESVIDEMTGTEYQPWITPIYTPPSGEIESLFFSLQAAIGAIIIGFFFGYYYRGRRINT